MRHTRKQKWEGETESDWGQGKQRGEGKEEKGDKERKDGEIKEWEVF